MATRGLSLQAIILATLVGALLTAVYISVQYTKHYRSMFTDVVLDSNVLGEQRKVFIRLPTGYDPSKSYPLIIKTDGNFNLETWHSALNQLSTDNAFHNAILVAIPNQFWHNTRNRDLVPPYARKEVAIDARPVTQNDPELFGKANLFLAFIERELLPYLAENYALNNTRLLTGFSAGGSFVLYTLSTKPELFTAYFAFSPAAWYDNSVVVREFTKALPERYESPKLLFLSLGGAENPIITGSFNGLLNALTERAPSNLVWDHHISSGADHNQNAEQSVSRAIDSLLRLQTVITNQYVNK